MDASGRLIAVVGASFIMIVGKGTVTRLKSFERKSGNAAQER